MTEDLVELLQPHLENPELERKNQEEEMLAEQDRRKEEEQEEQKRLEDMIEEIKEATTAMKKVLQNSCFIRIAKKMCGLDGGEGLVNAKLSVLRRGKGKILVELSGITLDSKDRNCLKEGLTTTMNQEGGLEEAFKKISYDSYCIEILHNFLSTDNVKVTYIQVRQ